MAVEAAIRMMMEVHKTQDSTSNLKVTPTSRAGASAAAACFDLGIHGNSNNPTK